MSDLHIVPRTKTDMFVDIAGNGMGGRKTNEPAFSLFAEDSPAKKENNGISKLSSARGIRTEGDGMGGKKGADSFWDF